MVLESWSRGEPNARSWLETLVPVVEEMRHELRGRDPQRLAEWSGAEYRALQIGTGELRLTYNRRQYRITYPDLVAYEMGSGKECPLNLQSLFLYYLHHADGTPPAGRWISFRELPGGGFYHQAFQGYTGDRLIRELGDDLAGFCLAARRLGGRSEAIGSATFSFQVLPRVSLAVVYWQGDEDFVSRAQVLFDASASHYLPTDGLAVLGSRLVDHLLAAAGR